MTFLQDHFIEAVKRQAMGTLHEYGNMSHHNITTGAWDAGQKWLRCCGVNGFEDWKKFNIKYNTSSMLFALLNV